MNISKSPKRSPFLIAGIALAFLITTASADAQTKLPTNESGQIQFDSIINVDSALSQALYGRALKWAGSYFNSPRDAVKMKIPETYTIIANGVTDMKWFIIKGRLGYQITIECKDNRYRYTITDLTFYDLHYQAYPGEVTGAARGTSKSAEKARQNIVACINSIVASLQAEMIKRDNW
jgi:hypothetical protein